MTAKNQDKPKQQIENMKTEMANIKTEQKNKENFIK